MLTEDLSHNKRVDVEAHTWRNTSLMLSRYTAARAVIVPI
jgi:hypothetical protein